MEWMAWTLPTALFFLAIGAGLVIMTVWEMRSPTVLRKGLLPIATTRGDRFFIILLLSAFVHIAWLGLAESPLYIASAICVIGGYVLMRWG